MSRTLHGLPFSSYCRKAQIALVVAGTRYETALLDKTTCATTKALRCLEYLALGSRHAPP
jgi:glutathione S-transferase